MDDSTALLLRQLQTDTRDARANISDAKRSIAKLYTDLAELSATVQGAQGDNGLRSDVRVLEEWRARVEQHLNGLDSKLQHYLDVERERTCYGKIALRRHVEDHDEESEEEVEVKVAQIHSAGATRVQVLTLIGVFLSPVVMALANKLLESWK